MLQGTKNHIIYWQKGHSSRIYKNYEHKHTHKRGPKYMKQADKRSTNKYRIFQILLEQIGHDKWHL